MRIETGETCSQQSGCMGGHMLGKGEAAASLLQFNKSKKYLHSAEVSIEHHVVLLLVRVGD